MKLIEVTDLKTMPLTRQPPPQTRYVIEYTVLRMMNGTRQLLVEKTDLRMMPRTITDLIVMPMTAQFAESLRMMLRQMAEKAGLSTMTRTRQLQRGPN
jgi:hypothetical protein